MKNTVVVGELMYAPQLTWFNDNGPLPPNHGGNKLYDIEWLNEAILALNLDNGVTEYHRLYKYGVRNYTRTSLGISTTERSRCTGLSTGESKTPAGCST